MYQRATLANGLEVVGESIPHINSASLGLWIGAGSRDENAGQEGVSHLIEHMLFKGTINRNARQLAEAIDAVGGQLNAFTTREYTCYYVRMLDRHIPLGLELLAEMFCASLLDPDELAKEKGVILEEIKAYEDAPDEFVHDLLAQAVWPDQPLGRPILGTPSSVNDLSREDVCAYMSAHYGAENTVLAAAGRIDFAAIVHQAERLLAAVPPCRPRGKRTLPQTAISNLFKRKDTEQVHLCLGGPGVERRDPDKFAVLVLDSILGGSVSSRLFQKLREDYGLVYAICSAHSAFRDAGLFSIYAGTALGSAVEVFRLVLGEMHRLTQEKVDQAELARAKEQIRGNFLLSLESMNTRMSRLAKAAIFYDSILTPEEVLSRVDAVTNEDVLRMAQKLFATSRTSVASVASADLHLDLDKWCGRL